MHWSQERQEVLEKPWLYDLPNGASAQLSITWTFAYQEVKGVKTYVLQLNNYAKKTIVLTPQRP